MATVRQMNANRLNAQNSTGPISDEGKDRSRRNAIIHGLSGTGVVLPEDEDVDFQERLAVWKADFRPRDTYEHWLVEMMVVSTMKMRRSRRQETLLRARHVLRAMTCWDDDRRLEVETRAVGLAKNPALTVRALRQTIQGCDWLIERWEGLARIAGDRGPWNESQRTLALDLLGIAPELRDGRAPIDPPEESSADVGPFQQALAEDEIEAFHHLRASGLDDLDDHDRALAESGLSADFSRPLQNLYRYEARANHTFHWALSRFHAAEKARAPAPAPKPPKVPTPRPVDVPKVVEPCVPPPVDIPPPPPPHQEIGPDVVPIRAVAPAPTTAAEPRLKPPGTTLSGSTFAPPTGGNRQARRARRSLARKG
jgi:hypothetical protein